MPADPCPAVATHTPCPADYLAWHEWAEAMSATHDTTQCPACGLWAIWTFRTTGDNRMDTPALLTGSRAYGTPREDSDVDLVIRVRDAATLAAIIDAADPADPDSPHKPSAVGFRTASFRFGRLNLIIAHTDAQYATWAAGTAELVDRAPVTREEAVATFKRLRGGAS